MMKKNDVTLSVILLTYNHEKYIAECLNGILSQKTTFQYNIIIGDDASGDNTPKIIEDYAKRYGEKVIPILRKQNIGAVNNLVDLLKRTKSTYIAGCEGDDFWTDNNKLQCQVDFLEKNRKYIAVSHEISIVNEQGIRIQKKLSWICKERDYTWVHFKGIFLPGHPVALVFRNIFINQYQPVILSSIHESIADRTLALLLSLNGRIFRLPYFMASYRIREDEITSDNITRTIYQNTDYYLTDYIMNKKLEQLASNILKKKVRFSYHTYHILCRATIKLLLQPSRKRFGNWIDLLKCHVKYVVK